MVYMAGDNDLDNFGISDLREMKRVGSSDQVQVIAELDRSGPDFVSKRYHLLNESITPRLKDDVVDELDETDSGSPDQLTDFIKWGIENFPARHYFVIIWAHGAGALDDDLFYGTDARLRPRILRRGLFHSFRPAESLPIDGDASTKMRLIAPDDQARNFIDNVELKAALQNVGRPIHILGMDACLMSTIEVCYQLRGTTEIIVSSEAREPMEGWPYEGLLRKLTQKPRMTPEEVSSMVVDEFVKLYADYENSSTTLAACDVSKVDAVVKSFKELVDSLLWNLDKQDVVDAILLTRYIVKSDELIESADLCDLCELLAKKCRRKEIISRCRAFIQEFKDSKVMIKTQPLVGLAEHWHGLSVYFPTVEVSDLYANLDVIKEPLSNWKQFIDLYVDISGR